MTRSVCEMSVCLPRRDFLYLGVAAGTLAFLPGCSKNPVTGRRELMLMSASQEVDIDRENAPHQISADYGVVQDARLAEYVSGVGQAMVPRTHRPDMPYSFNCLGATYINAYAFPGGTIGITRGILLTMESEAELAALIGHEIGHVSARHTSQRMSRGMLASLAVAGAAVAIADERYAGVAAGLGAIGAGVLLASYGRDQEREADALGLEYTVRSGYSPEGFVGLMSMLNDLSGSREYNRVELLFSTHPMSRERYETALRQARSGRYDASKPLHRERYMDNTASLRAIRGAIEATQRGDAEMAGKRYDKAQEHYATALKIAPRDYATHLMMAKCLLAQEKPAEAAVYARNGRDLSPAEPQAHHVLGFASLQQGQFEQSLQAFSSYQQMLPGNPNAIFFIGYSHEGLGNRPAAAQHYEAFLKQVQDGPNAQHARQRLAQWSS
ncbi:M48 family metalloprotease [Desulfurispirillum indicum]|uniref:M48 family metalloprotease n=1 Tax=Desulfurispirillum indicum TaxID=936456 RepID=UPI001CFB783E|nr:M48 family metalloprotease [Desulfurispirillum indicum]UCZ56843.1 M48 family metalloprotease [Desulfurispirillum indicum]